MGDIERSLNEREDVFDWAAEKEGAFSDMRMMDYGPPENYAVLAAYYCGVVNTLWWLEGERSTDELLDPSTVDSYKSVDGDSDEE